MELLVGSKRHKSKENGAEEEMSKKNLEQICNNLRKKKPAGKDKIKNEAWIHADTDTKEKPTQVINEIWNKE